MSRTVCFGVFLATVIGLLPQSVLAVEWDPIDEATLAIQSPRIDSAADAEALFWRVSVVDNLRRNRLRRTIRTHRRIKIFTERGVEDQSTVDLPSYTSL